MTPEAPGVRKLHVGAFAGIFCVGVWATSFGPALPFLADEFGVSLDRAGLLLTLLFVGSIAASAAMAIRFHRREARLLGALGLLVAAAGVVGLGFAPSWPVALAAVTLLGVGDGLLVAAGHAIVATTARDVPAAINRLNLWFAAGAIAGPLWAGAVLSAWGEPAAVYSGVGLLALGAAVLLASAPRTGAPSHHSAGGPGVSSTTIRVMGAVLFLYVGAEIGLGSWVSTYSKEAFGAGVMAGATVAAGYWAALALGRVASGILFARGVPPLTVLAVSIAGALAMSAVLALADGSLAIGAAAAFGTGFCFGPIWPAAITIASKDSPSGAPAAMVTVGKRRRNPLSLAPGPCPRGRRRDGRHRPHGRRLPGDAARGRWLLVQRKVSAASLPRRLTRPCLGNERWPPDAERLLGLVRDLAGV